MEKWWTEQLYDKAYEIVKDRKYPVMIPSYNRPNPEIVSRLFSNMTPESNYPVFVVVRESQKEEYMNSIGGYYGITILPFPDEEICNLGFTRTRIMKWCHENGYKGAFMFDDDILDLHYLTHKVTVNNREIAGPGDEQDISRVLAMWQMAQEYGAEKHNLMGSAVQVVGLSWPHGNIEEDKSLIIYRSPFHQCVCINIEGLVENDLFYRDSMISEHEDIDMAVRITQKGFPLGFIPFITYKSSPPFAGFNGHTGTLIERLEHQCGVVRNNFPDVDWLDFRLQKDGTPGVYLNWRKIRKMLGVKDYRIDIWNNGNLIKNS